MDFRLGVIGAGTHGERYLRHAAKDVPGMATAGLMRRDATVGAELARQLDCACFQSPQELVENPAIDGVVVCTPPSSHGELAALVLAADKPLLLEKPMTATLQEARNLTDLARDAGPAALMVAHTLRWNPVIRKARELWPHLGRVHLVRLAQRLSPTTLAWQRNPAETVGGSVLLTGVHLFDLVRFLTGAEFLEIDSRQEQVLNPAVEDLFLARGRLDDGSWVSLEVSKFTQSRACWLEAVGENGQLWADYQQGGIVLRSGGQETRMDIDARVPTLPAVLTAWLTSVRDQEPPPVTAEDGLATMQVVDACYRSAGQKTAVAVT